MGSVDAAPHGGPCWPTPCGPLLGMVTSSVGKLLQPFSAEFPDNRVNCGVVSSRLGTSLTTPTFI